MSAKLTDAVRALERAKESAQLRLEEIDRERMELKASIRSLEAALNKLGTEGRKSPKDSKRKAATTAEVIGLLEEVLSNGQDLSMEEVIAQVGELMTKHGMTRAGLALRIKQAVRDEKFETTQGRIRARKLE